MVILFHFSIYPKSDIPHLRLNFNRFIHVYRVIYNLYHSQYYQELITTKMSVIAKVGYTRIF